MCDVKLIWLLQREQKSEDQMTMSITPLIPPKKNSLVSSLLAWLFDLVVGTLSEREREFHLFAILPIYTFFLG